MSQSSIVPAGSVSDFFHDVVGDVIRARRVDATDGATTYLVSLLSDFARPDEQLFKSINGSKACLASVGVDPAVDARD